MSPNSRLIGRAAKVAAYLDQRLSEDPDSLALLVQASSDIAQALAKLHPGPAQRPGRHEAKLFTGLIAKVTTKIGKCFPEIGERGRVRMEFLLKLGAAQARGVLDRRLIDDSLSVLTQLLPTLKTRCLVISGKRVKRRTVV